MPSLFGQDDAHATPCAYCPARSAPPTAYVADAQAYSGQLDSRKPGVRRDEIMGQAQQHADLLLR